MKNVVDVSGWYSYLSVFIKEIQTNPYLQLEDFLKYTNEAVYCLPYQQIKPLLDFKINHKPGFLLLKGFEQDPHLIPTYEASEEIIAKKKTFYSEFWLALVAKILGEPIGYAQERNGEVFQNVRPRQGQETKIASDSSGVVLDLHVENGYHPIRPDYLLLYGLRQDRHQKGHTLAIEIEEILPLLSPEEIAILSSKQFRTSVDWNFGNLDAERGTGPEVAILFGDPKNPMIFYDDEYVIGTTVESQAALEKLRVLLHQKMQGILLKPGEMLVFDNYKCLHGRTSFQAHYDGNDRWLQRLLVIRDLSLNQKLLRNSGRILDWCYKAGEYYGNVVY